MNKKLKKIIEKDIDHVFENGSINQITKIVQSYKLNDKQVYSVISTSLNWSENLLIFNLIKYQKLSKNVIDLLISIRHYGDLFDLLRCQKLSSSHFNDCLKGCMESINEEKHKVLKRVKIDTLIETAKESLLTNKQKSKILFILNMM